MNCLAVSFCPTCVAVILICSFQVQPSKRLLQVCKAPLFRQAEVQEYERQEMGKTLIHLEAGAERAASEFAPRCFLTFFCCPLFFIPIFFDFFTFFLILFPFDNKMMCAKWSPRVISSKYSPRFRNFLFEAAFTFYQWERKNTLCIGGANSGEKVNLHPSHTRGGEMLLSGIKINWNRNSGGAFKHILFASAH